MQQGSTTRPQDNTITIERITTALHEGQISVATLLAAREITHRRALKRTSLAAATDEFYGTCARLYEQRYNDREDFDFMWVGVEDVLRRIFD